MKEPSSQEIETFIHVREYFRTHAEARGPLTAEDDLLNVSNAPEPFVWPRGLWEGTKFAPSGDWGNYVESYFRAARELVAGPSDESWGPPFKGIYPVLFLYRHFIELMIKGLMMDFSWLQQRPHPDFGNDHDLQSLWRKLCSMLTPGHKALSDVAHIERLLTQMSSIDPRSMDSRYALRRDKTITDAATVPFVPISVRHF